MNTRLFLLLERLQKLDERLRLARSRRIVDPFEVARLGALKLAIKHRLSRLIRSPLAAI